MLSHFANIAGVGSAGRGRRRRGFTAVEVLIVLLLMGIAASIGVDSISAYENSSRPERAARECLAAFRYARQLAVTTGKSTKVTFNTSTNAFSVYWMSNGSAWDANPVSQTAGQGGTYTVTMSTAPELRGVTLSLNPSGTTAFTYTAQGSLDSSTVITFTLGTRTKTLTVSRVGDPTVN